MLTSASAICWGICDSYSYLQNTLGLTRLACRAFGRAVFYILLCAVFSARSVEKPHTNDRHVLCCRRQNWKRCRIACPRYSIRYDCFPLVLRRLWYTGTSWGALSHPYTWGAREGRSTQEGAVTWIAWSIAQPRFGVRIKASSFIRGRPIGYE